MASGLSPEDADDLLQEFVATKILEKELIGRADAELGKFRTFLLTALDRFLIDCHRGRERPQAFAGEGRLRVLGDGAEQLQADQSSDAFDLAWARNVIDETVRIDARRVRDARAGWTSGACSSAGCSVRCCMARSRSSTRIWSARFGLQSPSQASNLLITAKRMFARVLRTVVGEYALGSEEIESEIRELMEVLAHARG